MNWLAGELVVVIDAPTLYETGYLVPLCSAVMVVGTTPERQQRWLELRNNVTAAEAKSRIKSQLPLEEKIRRATYTVMNSSTKAEFMHKIEAVVNHSILGSACGRVRFALSHLFTPTGLLLATNLATIATKLWLGASLQTAVTSWWTDRWWPIGSVIALVITCLICWRYHPPLSHYPWVLPGVGSSTDEGTVCFAGSFNPPHRGHLSLLKHLGGKHKKVFAVIGLNPAKSYSVTPEQRRDLLQSALAAAEATNVEAVVVKGTSCSTNSTHPTTALDLVSACSIYRCLAIVVLRAHMAVGL